MADDDIGAILGELIDLAQDRSNQGEVIPEEQSPAHLRDKCAQFIERHEFKPGDLVRWKKGFRHKKRPAYGQPAVVIQVLEEPVVDKENGAGSPYFNEPLELVLGLIDRDGDFVCYHFDSRRFEPYSEAS